MHHFLLSIDDDRSGCGRGIPAVPPASGRFLIGFWYRQRHFTTHRAMGQSFTAKTPKDATEEKSLTAKAAKQKKSLTAKNARGTIIKIEP